jgi:hypothetical protein
MLQKGRKEPSMKPIRINDIRQRLYDKGFRVLPKKDVEVFWPWTPGDTHGNLDDVQDAFDTAKDGIFFVAHVTSLYGILDGDLEFLLADEEIDAIDTTENQMEKAGNEHWRYPPNVHGDVETKAVVLLPPCGGTYPQHLQKWAK